MRVLVIGVGYVSDVMSLDDLLKSVFLGGASDEVAINILLPSSPPSESQILSRPVTFAFF